MAACCFPPLAVLALLCGRACAGRTADKTATGLTYIPAPKLKLPGHEESYNPPKEYIPTEVCVEEAGARP